MNKGFNQIDLVFAVMIVIFVIFLSFYYSSHFIQSPLNRAKSLEIKYLARGLGDTVFDDQGIPGEWQWASDFVKPSLGSHIYRVPVHLREWNGTENTDVSVSVYLYTEGNAHDSAIIVYDGDQLIPTELSNMTYDGDGFLEEVNVTFLVIVPAYEEKIINIYYSKDNETSVSYSSVPDTSNTLNITRLSAERYLGLTTSKMNALDGVNLQEAREKFGVDHPFRLRVEKTAGDWEYGYNLTWGGVGVNRRRVLMQNSTGHIGSVSAITYVWK